jgi:SAM-dependent methyltransferase
VPRDGIFTAVTTKRRLIGFLRDPRRAWIWRIVFVLRGIVYAGRRYQCPCCNWSFRAFTDQPGVLSTTTDGYCPRCNAKARHRRIWLYLESHTDLASRQTRLLEIAPWWAFARRFQKMSNIEYTSLDLESRGPHVTDIGDASDMPFESGSYDTVMCVHVLEHVVNDRDPISEMYRVLKPGGWALVTVPLNLDGPTVEDPSITDPIERERLFGEPSHVRFYGLDIRDRLEQVGFRTALDLGAEIPVTTRIRFGLRDDENIFTCAKPLDAG